MRWRECRDLVRSDAQRFVDVVTATGVAPRRHRWKLYLTPEVAALVLYRLSHWCHRRGWLGCAGWLYRLNVTLTGADIHPTTEIGPACLIVHTVGTVLFGRLGREVTVYARVIVDGAALPATLEQAPVIGDRVVLGAMSSVLGAVRIAEGVKIAPGSLIDFTVDEPDLLLSRLPGEKIHTTAIHRPARHGEPPSP